MASPLFSFVSGKIAGLGGGGPGDFTNGGEAGGANRSLGNTDAFALSLLTSGLPRLFIDGDGEVGIGNTNPGAQLDVQGAAVGVPVSRLTGVAGQTTNLIEIDPTNGGTFLSGFDSAGEVFSEKTHNYSLERLLPNVVDDAVDIGSFNISLGAGTFFISTTANASNFSVAKQYIFTTRFFATLGVWNILDAITDSGSSGSNYTLEVNVTSNVISLRMRTTVFTIADIVHIQMRHEGLQQVTFTPSSVVNSVTAPTVCYQGTIITQVNGRLGVHELVPSATMDVLGVETAIPLVELTTPVGQVGNVLNIHPEGNLTPLAGFDVNGDVFMRHAHAYSIDRVLPLAIDDAVDIGTFTGGQQAGAYWVSIVSEFSGASLGKQYFFTTSFNATGGVWEIIQPISVVRQGFDFDLEINISTGVNIDLRIRKTLGVQVPTLTIMVRAEGASKGFIPSTAVNSVVAPTVIYETSSFTQINSRIGIRTQAPTQALDVDGNIRASGDFISGVTTLDVPDAVFAEDYALMPLDKVASYVQAHKHLPGVPSAQDIHKNGLSLVTMQMALLEKIEELTLHVIHQDKELQTLKGER